MSNQSTNSYIIYPKGKETGEFVVYLKNTGGNKPDTYYKVVNNKVLDEVLKQVNEKGASYKNGKSYDKVTGDELTKVKTYFKPI